VRKVGQGTQTAEEYEGKRVTASNELDRLHQTGAEAHKDAVPF